MTNSNSGDSYADNPGNIQDGSISGHALIDSMPEHRDRILQAIGGPRQTVEGIMEDADGAPDLAAMGWVRQGEHWVTPQGVTIRADQVESGGGFDPARPEGFTKEQADPAQIWAFEKEIARRRAELEEVEGYDPQTGGAILKFQGEQRRVREVTLKGMEANLPAMKYAQRKAAEWRAENVMPPHVELEMFAERQQRLHQRAAELADEREARALADSILAKRRAAGIQGPR